MDSSGLKPVVRPTPTVPRPAWRAARKVPCPALSLRLGRLRLEAAAQRLRLPDGASLALTPYQTRLMVQFLSHPGQPLTSLELVQAVWEYQPVEDLVESARNNLMAHLTYLRQRLAKNPAAPVVRGAWRRRDGRLTPKRNNYEHGERVYWLEIQ